MTIGGTSMLLFGLFAIANKTAANVKTIHTGTDGYIELSNYKVTNST